MFDLLSTLPNSANPGQHNPMTVVEDDNGVHVKGLNCHLAQTEEDALNYLFEVCLIQASSVNVFSIHYTEHYM